MAASNPTMKQNLKQTKSTHSRVSCNNIPGSVPPITCIAPRKPILTLLVSRPRWSPCHAATLDCVPQIHFIPIPGGLRQHNLISQEAIISSPNVSGQHCQTVLPPTNWNLSVVSTSTRSQYPWSIHPQEKPLAAIRSWCTILRWAKYGKQHLEKILGERHKAMWKRARKRQMPYLSWLTLRSRTFPRIKPSHTPMWPSIFGPRKLIRTEYESPPMETWSTIQANSQHAQQI